MFKWIRKRILKGIVKDVIKELPEYKEKVLDLLEVYKDELLDKLQEVIKDTVKKFITDMFNKEI